MAILINYPPSNVIPPIYSPAKTLKKVAEGESVVIDNRDRRKEGRVMLEFGSWAKPMFGLTEGPGEVPSPGTKVTYVAYEPRSFYYTVNASDEG